MSHSHGKCLYHFVFSTLNRHPTICQDWQPRLWAYMGGIARTNGMEALLIGGTVNHSHVLLTAPPTMAPAKAVQLIKGGSSKWVHEELPQGRQFAWQQGYGVFTIGFSQIDITLAYIANQAEHHRAKTFEEEYRAFLALHMIEVEDEYLFG